MQRLITSLFIRESYEYIIAIINMFYRHELNMNNCKLDRIFIQKSLHDNCFKLVRHAVQEKISYKKIFNNFNGPTVDNFKDEPTINNLNNSNATVDNFNQLIIKNWNNKLISDFNNSNNSLINDWENFNNNHLKVNSQPIYNYYYNVITIPYTERSEEDHKFLKETFNDCKTYTEIHKFDKEDKIIELINKNMISWLAIALNLIQEKNSHKKESFKHYDKSKIIINFNSEIKLESFINKSYLFQEEFKI